MHEPLPVQQPILLLVETGDNLSIVIDKLERQGLVKSPKALLFYAWVTNSQLIQKGEYQLNLRATPLTLLRQLNKGEVKQHFVTLVEGWTYQQVLDQLQSHQYLQPLDSPWQASEAIAGYDNSLSNEGLLYSNTYAFNRGDSVANILNLAHTKLIEILEQEWQRRALDLPYKHPYEALIMASIIEKETGVAHERSKIAGTFVRRLQLGMKLQADPTVIYGMGKLYLGDIKRQHLIEPTAFNTYVIPGLPPTPISLVGRAAIQAALQPDAGDSLYFVAKGDGSHHFSSNLKEHQEAVQRYQIKGKKN